MDTDQKLVDILVSKGLIAEKTAQEVRLSSINSGKSVVDILLQKHLVSDNDIFSAKAEIYHVPFITLAGKGLSPEILTLVPESVARRYKLIPFDLDKKDNKLLVAMTDPLDLH